MFSVTVSVYLLQKNLNAFRRYVSDANSYETADDAEHWTYGLHMKSED